MIERLQRCSAADTHFVDLGVIQYKTQFYPKQSKQVLGFIKGVEGL